MSDQDFTQDVQANGGEFTTSENSQEEQQQQQQQDQEEQEQQTQDDENGGGYTTSSATASGQEGQNQEGSENIQKGTDDNTGEDRKLFVGGLSWETREPQLKEYFEQFGEVETVNLKLDPVTGKSRCFAFIVYKNGSDVNKVLEKNEHAINSKKVDVKKARAKPGKLFVGGLKPEMSDEQIRQAFEPFGTIIEFEMPFDKNKNQRKGFGFITFEREETMKELLKKGKVQVGEHMVDLRKATPKPDPKQAYMGGYGGYGGYGGDYYGGYGDYYGGYGGYGDYYGAAAAAAPAAGAWSGYAGYGAPPMQPVGGGKMRGMGRGAAAKRGAAPY